MNTSSPTIAAVGRTAAERAGRDAAASVAGITEASPHLPIETVSIAVLRQQMLSPWSSDAELAAALRAVVAECDRRIGWSLR